VSVRKEYLNLFPDDESVQNWNQQLQSFRNDDVGLEVDLFVYFVEHVNEEVETALRQQVVLDGFSLLFLGHHCLFLALRQAFRFQV